MGITGLLPFLENATRPCHISECRGATVAIDTYCWLHKGANACAVQLARGEDSQVYVNYCMKYIKMLQHYNIRPILVFDGKNLPAKADTEAKRRESRNKAKQRAAELLRLGKADEARTYLKQSINITPDMASEVIKECHKINVDCIVAPYESDAQLAFFSLKGIAEFVITEDSDLVLFGCSKIIFKLDLQGCGSLVEADKIPTAMGLRPDRYSFDKFRYMCILSGCDYIESLRGIGLKKALKFMSLTEETNPEIFLDKIPRYLNMRHLKITNEYKENFLVADATFRHQTVFDPFKKKLVPLVDPEITGTKPEFCKNAGEIFDHETAYQVALGNIHPNNFKPLDNWSPANETGSSNSIWSGIYKKSISHFERKAQFKAFFTSTKSTKTNVETKIDVDVEQIKIEEDLRTVKELEFYTNKKKEVDDITINTTEENVNDDSPKKDASPVLKRNPFIKKKLSKFHCTNSDSQIIVKSRYFSNDSDNLEEINNTDEIQDDIRRNGIEVKMETDTDTVCEIIEKKEITVNFLAEVEKETICEDVIEVETEKTDINYDMEIEQCHEISPKKNITNVENNQKRKVIGPCRTIGLKRTKSDSGTQQTLHQLFAKWRKK
ncbi:exonuclease 1 [Anoplophora glabripennis]|uniref:exonuclease 1 n=1 Tax=Anoplophora glabripennis TaxID=217634 RepID=UPI0008735CF9|nr:exonuclease 1 [Anoplophora glabripennis]